MSLNIQYCSDLHLEFEENSEFIKLNPLEPVGTVLILAGDVIPFTLVPSCEYFFDYISANFQTTYWLPGNHEYYNFDIADKTGTFCEAIRKNIFLVNNFVIEHESTNIIFSTLWSKIGLDNRRIIQRGMNDFYQITFRGNGILPHDYNLLHEESRGFIIKALSMNKPDKTVIVTHHVPTFINYPSIFSTSPLNQAFASELSDLIERFSANYWIYGHHHVNVPDFTIGNTRLITNQLGYVARRENYLFNRRAIIKV